MPNKKQYKKQQNLLYITPAVFAVVISGFFKLNFIGTLLCGLLSGLLLAAVTWAIKRLIKKKLCALILVEKPEGNNCKITVLLWNPTPFTVYSSDYGEYGFCLDTDYDVVINDFKANEIKAFGGNKSRAFEKVNLNLKHVADDNSIELRMKDSEPKSLYEFEFSVSKKDEAAKYSWIILPPGMKMTSCFTDAPTVSLLYDHSNINISIVKYEKPFQFFHWLLPPFVVKYMKTKEQTAKSRQN